MLRSRRTDQECVLGREAQTDRFRKVARYRSLSKPGREVPRFASQRARAPGPRGKVREVNGQARRSGGIHSAQLRGPAKDPKECPQASGCRSPREHRRSKGTPDEHRTPARVRYLAPGQAQGARRYGDRTCCPETAGMPGGIAHRRTRRRKSRCGRAKSGSSTSSQSRGRQLNQRRRRPPRLRRKRPHPQAAGG